MLILNVDSFILPVLLRKKGKRGANLYYGTRLIYCHGKFEGFVLEKNIPLHHLFD